jgi:hypothetical protein
MTASALATLLFAAFRAAFAAAALAFAAFKAAFAAAVFSISNTVKYKI